MTRRTDEVATGRPASEGPVARWEQRLIDDCVRSMAAGTMQFRNCHRTAARILAGIGTGDPELLHPGIVLGLNEIDDLCRADGGELHSRQVIATFIFAWRNANPGARVYGE